MSQASGVPSFAHVPDGQYPSFGQGLAAWASLTFAAGRRGKWRSPKGHQCSLPSLQSLVLQTMRPLIFVVINCIDDRSALKN
jgi:hypothetical protein